MVLNDHCVYQQNILLSRKDQTFFANIYIAHISFEQLSHQVLDFLHKSEYAYYQTLMHKNRQYSFLLGRYCAKQTLAMAPFSMQSNLCEITPGVFGQPVIQSQENKNVQISIAHCGDKAAALAYPEAHPMGIDIEQCDDKNIEVMQKQMTIDELNLISRFINNKTEAITLLWTAKEALSKILRTGFMVPFSLLEISESSVEGDFFYCKFKNFHQYKSCSFKLNEHFISLVYPHQTKMQLDVFASQ
jgi:4'-phosphopantetheinyl transferase